MIGSLCAFLKHLFTYSFIYLSRPLAGRSRRGRANCNGFRGLIHGMWETCGKPVVYLFLDGRSWFIYYGIWSFVGYLFTGGEGGATYILLVLFFLVGVVWGDYVMYIFWACTFTVAVSYSRVAAGDLVGWLAAFLSMIPWRYLLDADWCIPSCAN